MFLLALSILGVVAILFLLACILMELALIRELLSKPVEILYPDEHGWSGPKMRES